MKNILKQDFLDKSCEDIDKQPTRFIDRVNNDFEKKYNGELNYLDYFDEPVVYSVKDDTYFRFKDGTLENMGYFLSENDFKRLSFDEFNLKFNNIGNILQQKFKNKAMIDNELQIILSSKDTEIWFDQLLLEQDFSDKEIKFINQAKKICKVSHKGQFRDEGVEYYSHPIFVAIKGMELGINYEEIISLLLHDTIEDTNLSYEEIKSTFGIVVADNILGLSKKDSGKELLTKQEYYKNISKSKNLAILKGLDRLANLYSLNFASPEKQIRYLEETKNVIIPIVVKYNNDLAKKIQLLIDYIEDKSYSLPLEIVNRIEDLSKIKEIKEKLSRTI